MAGQQTKAKYPKIIARRVKDKWEAHWEAHEITQRKMALAAWKKKSPDEQMQAAMNAHQAIGYLRSCNVLMTREQHSQLAIAEDNINKMLSSA